MARIAGLNLVGALALAAATVFPAAPSQAREHWHHEGGWGGGHEWRGDHDCGGCGIAGALLGLGVGAAIGAAIAGGGAPPPGYYAAPPPVYAPPPPVYYPAPPAAYPPPAVYYGGY